MGTNFYARIIPTNERKEKLKKLIDDDDFDEIKNVVSLLYSKPEFCYYLDDVTFGGGEVHLGKRSGGWKFLWNPNWYKHLKGHCEKVEDKDGNPRYKWVEDGFDVFKFYDLSKESIKKFIDREDVVIYNEYGEKQDKEEFWNMALSWGYEEGDKGLDGESYEQWEMEQNPKYIPHDYANEYSRFIEECGFKVCKYHTDFYSDGLRFATSTDFS